MSASARPTVRVPTDLPPPQTFVFWRPAATMARPGQSIGVLEPMLNQNRTAYVLPRGEIFADLAMPDDDAILRTLFAVMRHGWRHTFAIDLSAPSDAAAMRVFFERLIEDGRRHALLSSDSPDMIPARIQRGMLACCEQALARTCPTGLPLFAPPDAETFPPPHVRFLTPFGFGILQRLEEAP